MIRVVERKAGYAQSGLAQLIGGRNKNIDIAAVALANKNASIAWALLARELSRNCGAVDPAICLASCL